MVQPGEEADAALRRADEAMYEAKRGGRGAVLRGAEVSESSDVRR